MLLDAYGVPISSNEATKRDLGSVQVVESPSVKTPEVKTDESRLLTRRKVLGLLGNVLVASASGTVGVLWSQHEAALQRGRDATGEVAFFDFCSDINFFRFDQAADKARRAAAALRKNGSGEDLVWEFNRSLCDAIRGLPTSVIDLRNILNAALPYKEMNTKLADWHYFATCDLLYFNMLFFDAHPEESSSAFEREAYSRLEGGGVHSKNALVELNAYIFHVYELSPSLIIADLSGPQLFLRSKLRSLRRQYIDAEADLRACQELHLDANDGGLAVDLARALLLPSLGNYREACLQASDADKKISKVQSETRRIHLQTVTALLEGNDADLSKHLKAQEEKARKRGISRDIFRSDNANLLGGQDAIQQRRKYARAGLKLLDRADPDNLARIISLQKSAA